MSCGCDWGSFEAMYDELVALDEADRDARYGSESPAAAQRGYERGISNDAINADVLADAVAGHK